MRPLIRVLVAVALFATSLTGVPAAAAVGEPVTGLRSVVQPRPVPHLGALVETCREMGLEENQCRGLDQLIRIPANLCRDLTDNNLLCTRIDGRMIADTLVTAFESSWVARTFAHQRDLDHDRPLREAQWIHTHNSYNADAYPPTIYGLDPNQHYTMSDQLRMGVRALEIDIHWLPELGRVAVCHGEPVDLGITIFHLGCSPLDPTLDESFSEVRGWMDDHPEEVLMLYLENNLDGEPEAHAQTVAALDRHFGDLVHRPDEACADLDVDMSRKDIHEAGARIILVGNCGPGAWGSWVWERGARWQESSIGYGDVFPAFPCITEREQRDYENNLIRRWGDETGLSASVGAGGDVTPSDAHNMVRCGVNWIGFDNLVPYDERLLELAWSWAPDEPVASEAGLCAYHGEDGRFYSAPCTEHRHFACWDGEAWTISGQRGPWVAGGGACTGSGGVFEVPRTGYANELLTEAKEDAAEVWLAYRTVNGHWEPGP